MEAQGQADLKTSLAMVNDALRHPGSFGTVAVDVTPSHRVWRRGQAREVATIGIMPALLEAKKHIESRLTREPPRIGLPGPGIDTLAKGLGIIGIAAFAILFAAYYQFYSTVGIKPEDIGVGYTYVVTRSIGMLFVLIAAAAYVGYPVAMSAMGRRRRLRSGKPPPRMSNSRTALIAVTLVAYACGTILLIFRHRGSNAVFVGMAVVFFLLGTMALVQCFVRNLSSRLYYLTTVAIVLLGFAVGLATYAHDLGERVRRGGEASPVMLLGAPLLDVQARYVSVQWIGPPGQRPDTLFSGSGPICVIDLGRNASTAYMLTTGRGPGDIGRWDLVYLPITMVAVSGASLPDCRDPVIAG